MASPIFDSDVHRRMASMIVTHGGWPSTADRPATPARAPSKGGAASNKRRAASSTPSPALSPAPLPTGTPLKGRSKSRAESEPPAAPSITLPPWEEFKAAVLVPAVEKALDVAFRNRSLYIPNGKSADGRSMVAQEKVGNGGSGGMKGQPSTPMLRRLFSSNESSTPTFATEDTAGGGSQELSTGGVVIPVVFAENDFLLENAEILNEVRSFAAPPFTLQRICEILLDHEKHHVTPAPIATSVAGSGRAEEAGIASPHAGKKRQRSNTPTRATSVVAEGSPTNDVKGPAPRIRGEKLQAALRKCALVSTAY